MIAIALLVSTITRWFMGQKNITIKASEIKVTMNWDGDRVFSITTYDSFGFAST